MLDHAFYLSHLSTESQRFRDVLADCPPDARVPSCPDWDALALLDHLTGVQWFWGTVVRDRLTDATALSPPTLPRDRAALLAAYDAANVALHDALASTDPATEVYMWAEDKRTGFIARRQALEAAVHRIDAELAAGLPVTAVEPELAADGVLEVLDVMYGGCPPWGTFEATGPSVLVRCDDTGDDVPLTLGRFTGTDPEDRQTYDEPDLAVRSFGGEPDAVVSGTASDLLAWLWHRADGAAVERSGDAATLEALHGILRQPIT